MGFITGIGTPLVDFSSICRQPPALSDNTELSQDNGYYRSKGEFGVKALMDDTFALLYIPRNAAVHVARNIDSDDPWRQFVLAFGAGRGKEDGRFDPNNKNALKHRASRAFVIDICQLSISKSSTGQEVEARMTLNPVTRGCSIHDHRFFYNLGEWLEIKEYEYRVDDECASGIHYFPYAGAAARYAYYDQLAGATRGYGKTVAYFDFISSMSLKFALSKNLLCKWAEESSKEFKEHSPIFEADHNTEALAQDIRDQFNAALHELAVAASALNAFHEMMDKLNAINVSCNIPRIINYTVTDELLTKKFIEDLGIEEKPP